MLSKLSSALFSFLLLVGLFPMQETFAQTNTSVEIVFDVSGSMNDQMYVGKEAAEDVLSFIPSVLAQDDFGTLDPADFEIPEFEIPELVPLEIEPLPPAPVFDPAIDLVIDDVDAYPPGAVDYGEYREEDYKKRIDVARESLASTLKGINPQVEAAFRVFGGSCGQSDLLIDFAPDNAEKILEKAEELQPDGSTPLAYAIGQARQDLEQRSGTRKIVVITDGEDTCGGDLLAEAALLKDIELKADLIYFGGDQLYGTELQEFADIVGGSFVNAASAEELTVALEASLGEVAGVDMSCNLWVLLIFFILMILLILWGRKRKLFASLKHAVGYGFLLWAVMFAIASILLPLKSLAGYEVLFTSILSVFGPIVVIGCLLLYLRQVKKVVMVEMVLLGLLWMLIAWFFDLLFFTWGPEPMGVVQYVMEIGLDVVGIGVIVIGVGYALLSRKR